SSDVCSSDLCYNFFEVKYMTHTITMRLPKELADNLTELADNLGLTRSEMIRTAILKYVVVDNIPEYSQLKVSSNDYVRSSIKLNDLLFSIVENQAKNNHTSVNSLIVFAAQKTFDYYSELLTKLDL